MYRAFYGLREKPFNLTPDPRFLYLSDKHKEAFAHLLYGIRSRSGFVMVSGEIGTGKTTICRNLLNQLDEDTELAFIFNPMLSPLELLKKIASEFGVDCKGANALELTEELNQYLLEAAAKGKNCVLLIDEAQNLDPQVLEQIRLLSNLETETEKLLQIVLIGQPELSEKLALHELRQLNQRITARYHLKPLSEKEVMQYIAYRLHVAGGRRKITFNRAAVRAVYKISGGTPRVINAVCDRSLLIGFTKEIHTITASVVNRAYREIRGDDVFSQRGVKNSLKRYLFHPVAGVAVLLLVVIAFVNSPVLRQRTTGYLDSLASLLPEVTPPPPKPKPVAPLAAVVDDVDDLESNAPVPAAIDSPGAREAARGELPTATEKAVALAIPQVLFENNEGDATRAALDVVLAAWGKSPKGPLPETLEPAPLEAFARENSLSVEFLRPAIAQLLALDLPVIVFLNENDSVRAATIAAADESALTLRSGETSWTMDRSDFRKKYTGDAIVLWEDRTPNAATLMPGSQNANVRELRSQLAAMGRIPNSENSDRYDGELSKAVARIQAETSLEVDGIAGKQVRMVIQSWSKPEGTPGLGSVKKLVAAQPESNPTTPAEVAIGPVAPEATAPEPEPKVVAAVEPVEEIEAAPVTPEAENPAPTAEAIQVEAPEVSTPAPTPIVAQDEATDTASPDIAPVESEAAAPVTLSNVTPPDEEAPEGETVAEPPTPDVKMPAPESPAPPEVPETTTTPEATEAPREETITSTVGGQLTVVELPDPGTIQPETPSTEDKPAG